MVKTPQSVGFLCYNKLMKNNLMKSKLLGFTLIEIMVVIGIIGILVTIVIVAGASAKKTARDNQRLTDIRLLQLKIGEYRNLNGAYPATLAQLNLTQMPMDPLTKQPYPYAGLAFSGSTNCATYHLGATMETNVSALSQKVGQSVLGANRQTSYVYCTNSAVTSSGDFDGAANPLI